MSAKNSGVSKEQYEQYNEDKRKAGEPVARRVVLEVWRIEDEIPEAVLVDAELNCEYSEPVLVWGHRMESLGAMKLMLALYSDLRWVDEDGGYHTIDNTSWAYIPDIKEAI